MKFIDELDVERVNQTLNFETSDCKITGGCDIFTTKPVASDKKLYKTIDNHLNVLLQENETYNAFQQRQNDLDNNGLLSPATSEQSRDCNSFWEQKRRMSVSDNDNQQNIGGTPISIRTSKLNDQNLKDLVTNSDNEYLSSSSIESSSNHGEKSRRSSSVAVNGSSSNNKFKVSKISKNRRRSSANHDPSNINIGPFGPINETASRRIFAYLIAILNASYPDHDFSSLEPTDFVKSSLKELISKFENSLYSLGKQPEEWMWEIINSHMDLSDCVIYRYDPNKSFLDDEPGHLWSLNWFIFNKKRKRVAYLYLYALRIQAPMTDIKETLPRCGRKLTIDHDSNQFEGEYDLVYDDNAIEDDSEAEAT
ncbi:hypothetical protein Kpol_1045p65 [Vanderwaltozyma polyspora DSM 70294]|uniref:Repressor of RNA polymerase III transcription MAF1 n=1 Tax=Vanderwaltozyma polyspora (strain ATCC 22028 / DSM 70294 / BCRC 21397 / CBS 2163 / NBRC 10782 / NRRL Y-8283 / UCD 57-17) TaxID=436907 RepID=A7TI71_VANPO|nr:uncharacterized protein Kpol_1045p65 [Vanderwaltozyma polyspora DSM 70294]EDO18078.1 hypothetical protein Kpol_1045p65 [Vanderwaltozyma polyspora DSM 70294]